MSPQVHNMSNSTGSDSDTMRKISFKIIGDTAMVFIQMLDDRSTWEFCSIELSFLLFEIINNSFLQFNFQDLFQCNIECFIKYILQNKFTKLI